MQILKLGLLGEEQDLPHISRSFERTALTEYSRRGRTANASFKKDYITVKSTWEIRYGMVTETVLKFLRSLYFLQHPSPGIPTFLSFVYEEENNTLVTKTVSIETISSGTLVFFRDGSNYYQDITIRLLEV